MCSISLFPPSSFSFSFPFLFSPPLPSPSYAYKYLPAQLASAQDEVVTVRFSGINPNPFLGVHWPPKVHSLQSPMAATRPPLMSPGFLDTDIQSFLAPSTLSASDASEPPTQPCRVDRSLQSRGPGRLGRQPSQAPHGLDKVHCPRS